MTISNTNVLKDISISALEVKHGGWTHHIWATALATLDQRLTLAKFAGLKRLALNISFHKILDLGPAPRRVPPTMPIAKERGILYFTFDAESCSFRLPGMSHCRFAPHSRYVR
jgi:hypothetical protein